MPSDAAPTAKPASSVKDALSRGSALTVGVWTRPRSIARLRCKWAAALERTSKPVPTNFSRIGRTSSTSGTRIVRSSIGEASPAPGPNH